MNVVSYYVAFGIRFFVPKRSDYNALDTVIFKQNFLA